MTQQTLPGLEEPGRESRGTLVDAARKSIDARRELGAIQPWHETLCAAVIELAEQAQLARGIAKAQLYAQMLAAEAKLPEPVVQESHEVVEREADRIRRYLDEYDERTRTTDILDAAQSASLQ